MKFNGARHLAFLRRVVFFPALSHSLAFSCHPLRAFDAIAISGHALTAICSNTCAYYANLYFYGHYIIIMDTSEVATVRPVICAA